MISTNDAKFNIAVMVFLALATLAATVPFFYDYLFCIDSANFALGIHHYSIDLCQPHPPGYPLFVFLGRALSPIVGDDNLSLILLANIFALAGILLLYRALAAVFGRTTALWGALIFAFNPVFWFYREVALTYAIDCFATAAVLHTAVMVRTTKSVRPFYGQMAILALVAGFRPTSALLLGGIVLFTLATLIRQERGASPSGYLTVILKRAAVGAAVFTVLALAWLVPMIQASGGIAHYLAVAGSFSGETSRRTSILDGAPAAMVMNQIKYFKSILVTSTLGMLPLLAAGTAALFSRRLFGRALEYSENPFSRRELLLLLVSLILPPVAVYTMIHFGQPGYILIMLPSLMVAASLGIALFIKSRWGMAVVVLSLAAQILLFVLPGTTTNPFRPRLYGHHGLSAADRVLRGISPYLLYFNLTSIREDNLRYSIMIDEIGRHARSAGPGGALIVIDQFHPFHENGEVRMNEPWASHMNYYFHDTDVAMVNGAAGKKTAYVMRNYRSAAGPSQRVVFDRRIRTAIIVTQQLDRGDIPAGLRFTKNRFTYVADCTGVKEFNFLGVTFARK